MILFIECEVYKVKVEPKRKYGKCLVANIVFGVLKRGVKACYKHDSRVRAILDKLPDGYVLALRVLPERPIMMLKKTDGKIVNVKKDEHIDLEICFKNIDVAMPVLTGSQGIKDTYKHSSIISYGSIGDTIEIVECLNIVESYLFPKFITSKIMNTTYKKEVSSLRIYLGVLLGV